jgi:hypothetical protein
MPQCLLFARYWRSGSGADEKVQRAARRRTGSFEVFTRKIRRGGSGRGTGAI